MRFKHHFIFIYFDMVQEKQKKEIKDIILLDVNQLIEVYREDIVQLIKV
jgi:hypothetical protein